MADSIRTTTWRAEPSRPIEAELRYFLLADITGYTAFLAGVESTHGVDFSGGIPAGFAIIGALLDAVIEGVQPTFEVSKLEGDAVFATASIERLDGEGEAVLEQLLAVNRAFRRVQDRQSREASDHTCTACPVAANLSLKMMLHRGPAVTVARGGQSELLGPAVNLVHRLLKNRVQEHIGRRPYLLLTEVAATALHLDEGTPHEERYDDVGVVSGRIIELE
jgi:hypothetical protein